MFQEPSTDREIKADCEEGNIFAVAFVVGELPRRENLFISASRDAASLSRREPYEHSYL